MSDRTPVFMLEPPTGATGDKLVKYDHAAGTVTWADGSTTGGVQSIVAGTGVTVDATDPANPVVSATGSTDPEVVRDTVAAALVAGTGVTITPNDAADTITISATGGGGGGGAAVVTPAFRWETLNPTSDGNVIKIASSGAASDVLVTDLDCTTLTAGVLTEVWIELWISQNRANVWKYVRTYLRDGGPTGTVLAQYDFPGPTVDRTTGFEQLWRYRKVVTPATSRLCVTVGPYTGANTPQGFPDVWSKVRWMQVTQ